MQPSTACSKRRHAATYDQNASMQPQMIKVKHATTHDISTSQAKHATIHDINATQVKHSNTHDLNGGKVKHATIHDLNASKSREWSRN